VLAFIAVEARTAAPMLPLAIFRSTQFTGANLTTLTVYAALNGALFLLAVQLQQSLCYSPLAAGVCAAGGLIAWATVPSRRSGISGPP
jgi:hypothetical protein